MKQVEKRRSSGQLAVHIVIDGLVGLATSFL